MHSDTILALFELLSIVWTAGCTIAFALLILALARVVAR